MSSEKARAFGVEWVAAWNAHDLDRVLSHYREDVVVTSAFVAKFLGDGRDSVHGKAALRAYWSRAFEAYPSLTFDLFDAYPGVDSVLLHYRSIAGLVAAEFMRFDSEGLVSEVVAHYLPEAGLSFTMSPVTPSPTR